MVNWTLVLGLAGLLAALQVALAVIARGLGRRLDCAAVVLGLALPFLLLAPWLRADRILVPTGALSRTPGVTVPPEPENPYDILNDTVAQLLPLELEVRRAFADGRLPLWSDLVGGGASPWSNPQAGALSPIAMLARPFPLQHFLLLTLALKLLVAAEGAWLLARVVGAGRRSALVAGAAYALGGGIMAWALFPVSQAAAWVPWVTAGAIRLVRRPSVAGVAATAVVTAALLLSGHPETALFGGSLAAGCALTLRHRARFWRGLGHAVLAALLGFALAAPHLVPFLRLAPTTARARETLARTTVAGSPRWLQPITWFYEFRGSTLLSPTNPQVFGRPYRSPFQGPINWPTAEAAYAGLLALGGAGAALLARRLRRARRFLVAAGLCLVLASQPIPLLRLLWTAPALRTLALDRLLMTGALALAMAGALGLDALRRAPSGLGPWLGLAGATLLSLVVRPGPRVVALWLLVWAAAALTRLGGGRGRIVRVAGSVALLAAVLADLLPWAYWQLPPGKPENFYPQNPLVQRARTATGAGGPWRVVGQDFLLYPNILGVYGLADVRPHDPTASADQLAVLGAAFDFAPNQRLYFAPFSRPDQPLLDFLNVRVVVSNHALPEPRAMERVDRGELGVFTVWRNPDALPRWFLAASVDPVPGDKLPVWIGRMTDPRRVAVAPTQLVGLRLVPGNGAVRALENAPGRVVLGIPPEPAGDRLLATSLSHPEGWRARDGSGRRLRRLTVNGAYLGVVVPAGVDRVTLRYVPPGLGLGCALGVIGVIGIAVCVVVACRKQHGPD